MNAIIFNTKAEAQERNQTEAYSRGCDENSTTQYWWSMHEGTNGQWALEIKNAIVEDVVSEIDESWIKVAE